MRPPARVVVDLGAIADNVRSLRARNPGSALMTVVKADAYGHGLVPVARAARGAGADWLGVAQPLEALALRSAGVGGPLMCWLHTPGTDFAALLAADVTLGVSAQWGLELIEAAAAAGGQVARVHLKVDTGLGRNGAFAPSDDPARPDQLGADAAGLIEAAARAQDRGHVRVTGLFSHFAEADEPSSPSVAAQQEVFERATSAATRAGLGPLVRHLANSAATLLDPSAAYDLVRPGLATYGLSPAPQLGTSADFGLRPAMQVAADLAGIKAVPAGQGVSYGLTYLTTVATRLGVVPMGYGDGVPRHASGAGPVTLGGRRFTVAGRVCMDQFVVDLGDAAAQAGDEVVLLGDPARGEPSAQDWADACGTISYEIVTRLSGRLPRTYIEASDGSALGSGALGGGALDGAAPDGGAQRPGGGEAGEPR
nr:alanine racemase [Kineosphaera limosa]